MEKKMCQVCGVNESQWELKSEYGEPSYFVCGNCLGPLVNCDLTPKQFKHVLSHGHDDSEYLLHGDFYDEDGNAIQPYPERDDED